MRNANENELWGIMEDVVSGYDSQDEDLILNTWMTRGTYTWKTITQPTSNNCTYTDYPPITCTLNDAGITLEQLSRNIADRATILSFFPNDDSCM